MTPAPSPRRKLALSLLLLLLALLAWRLAPSRSADRDGKTAPTAVLLSPVRVGPAAVELSTIGSVISPHSVSLRPQVSGLLKAVYFEDGDSVQAGQKLFLIDPAPFEAALAQARATLAVDRAAASAAQAQYERLKPLAAQDFVTAREFEDARAAAQSAAARVQADQAAVQSAQINLGYTLIRAPIAGRSGSIAVRMGNLVSSSDATPLVVINEIGRLQVQAAIPQDQLPAVQAAMAQATVPVRISASRDGATLANGQLVFIDNTVNASSGTVLLRAEVDNRSQKLWPGALLSMTLVLRNDPQALLVPESAVQTGADGPYVFVVDAQGKARLRNVTVDRQAGRELVITQGLKAGEWLIARPPHNLRPGSAVVDAGKPQTATGGSGP